jgi:hypothetical protein
LFPSLRSLAIWLRLGCEAEASVIINATPAAPNLTEIVLKIPIYADEEKYIEAEMREMMGNGMSDVPK